MLQTPVVFLIFNRPDVTAKVFEAIAAARPRQLLVVADGPRADRAGEAELCGAARAIVERVDWPCELRTKFSDTNLGCGKSVAGGIDWAFAQCERAIILEDDCLPHPDFFRFCEELLERYADDDRIAHIGGDHFHGNSIEFSDSYYFTRFPHVWGWATWRRAWSRYEFAMSHWPRQREDGTMDRLFDDPVEREFWRRSFDAVFSGELDTWDVQWLCSLLMHDTLAINPATNLISNIGFRDDATHTRGTSWMSELPVAPIHHLVHPKALVAHVAADQRTFEIVFDGARLRRKLAAT